MRSGAGIFGRRVRVRAGAGLIASRSPPAASPARPSPRWRGPPQPSAGRQRIGGRLRREAGVRQRRGQHAGDHVTRAGRVDRLGGHAGRVGARRAPQQRAVGTERDRHEPGAHLHQPLRRLRPGRPGPVSSSASERFTFSKCVTLHHRGRHLDRAHLDRASGASGGWGRTGRACRWPAPAPARAGSAPARARRATCWSRTAARRARRSPPRGSSSSERIPASIPSP